MEFHIQDPTDPESPFLQEKILELCESAESGGGAFAFASCEGVNLLFSDKGFKRFLSRGRFELIVGTDAITNPAALKSLKKQGEQFKSLDVKAFFTDRPQTTFHPKFCWFSSQATTSVLTGSGNLTFKGLRGNWEAFGIGRLKGESAKTAVAKWSDWRTANHARLRAVDDPEVLAKADENTRSRVPIARASPTSPEVKVLHRPINDVLIAELPRSRDRWNQANFHLEIFTGYFGAEPGVSRRVVLQHVEGDGELDVPESRPSVAVKSQNYRFELGAAAGKPYPAGDSRPIAVFVRIAPRTFRYRLVMPSDGSYSILQSALSTLWKGPSNQTRQIVTTPAFLKQIWPESPLWKKPLEIYDPSAPLQHD